MADDPTQDPSTFDPDEDLFNFDEVALDFYSSNDEEDLEEIFQAFEGSIEAANELTFGFDAVDNAANSGLRDEEPPPADGPVVARAPRPAPETDPGPTARAPVETFRADPRPAPPPAPAPIEAPLPPPETGPAPAAGPAPAGPAPGCRIEIDIVDTHRNVADDLEPSPPGIENR